MANDLNRVLLVGRLTRDPELKSTNSGAYLCRFSLASNRTIYQKDAENREEVGFFDCTAWGKLAEVISKYARKGVRVGIDGSLRWSSWEGNEGKKQSKVDIHVENFQFLDSKGAQQQDASEKPPVQEPTPSDFGDSQPEPFSDDIPF
ncbi:MAG: single-stranded DNA-binding protein [Leptospirales bacterium]